MVCLGRRDRVYRSVKGVSDKGNAMANEKQGGSVVFNADNVAATLDGKGMLTVLIDTNKRLRPSREGKSMIIATTGGNRPIGLADGSTFRLGITAYAPQPKAAVEQATV